MRIPITKPAQTMESKAGINQLMKSWALQ